MLYACVCRGYGSLHGSTSHQIDLVLYGWRYNFSFPFSRPGNHGVRMDRGPLMVCAGPHACSNSRIYMDHALGLSVISLVSWNETRDFPFVCSPSSGKGPWFECMWYVHGWVMDADHCMGVPLSAQYNIIYRSHKFMLMCSHPGDHGAGMRVVHVYKLISS